MIVELLKDLNLLNRQRNELFEVFKKLGDSIPNVEIQPTTETDHDDSWKGIKFSYKKNTRFKLVILSRLQKDEEFYFKGFPILPKTNSIGKWKDILEVLEVWVKYIQDEESTEEMWETLNSN